MDNIATLTSLAMLKVNSDVSGRDYVDYFIPFIGFVLNRDHPDPVTAPAVKNLLEKEFHLNIPTYPTEYALHRLADNGFLRREGYVYRIAKTIPTSDIDGRRNALREQHQAVVTHLREFASHAQQISWSDSDATDALLSTYGNFRSSALRLTLTVRHYPTHLLSINVNSSRSICS